MRRNESDKESRPTVETPPEHEAPQPPEPQAPALSQRGRNNGGGRYNYLDTHELITLLDEVDDERAKARFREAVYLAIIIWLVLVLAYIFLPRWLPHRPVLIVQQRNPNELTYLDTPPDLKNLLKPKPAPHISERSTEAQSPHPIKSPTPPEPKAGRPQPPAPKPSPAPQQAAPRPQQAAPQQPQQPAPQQQARVTPPPSPARSNTPIVDAPAPSQQRQPDFNNSRSAASAIADAAKNSRSAGGAQEQGDYGSTGRGNKGNGKAGVEVLSDMQGVDFSRYLARLLADIRRNWLPLIPEECNSPIFKQGITGVRFTIQPNGQITGMNLDYSTHDEAINRAAWGSIKSLGNAAPLPKEFHGPNLELRIEFRVNKDREVQ